MKSTVLTAALALLTASVGVAAPANKRVSGFQNTVYWTNWSVYARNYPPQKLPAGQINQVLYSFMNVKADGTVFSGDTYADLEQHYPTDSWNDVGKNAYGAVKQLGLIKKNNRHLKVILSIGGWTWSTNFPAVAASATARANFAKTSVALVKDWGLDGIDIDWEYPANSVEADNFILLLKDVRAALDAYSKRAAGGYRFLLTAATPAGPVHYNKLRLKQMGEILDYVNIMTYDYAGGWDLAHTGHQANLYPNPQNPGATPFSTDRAINDYLAAGVPGRKIIMGVPLYGRGFEGTSGLGKPATGTGQGTWEAGVYDYKVLPLPGSKEQYDSVSGASYSEDTTNKRIISYDTIESVTKKLGFLSTKGLGGTMFWEASGDRTDSKSIIAACFNGQGGMSAIDKTQNLLKYPESVYDNVRNGFA
ncbi:family 18 glycosyl hydrolase [Microdochium bolleyi]|uniref:chitinase n=1 Tax=Microdochium bolleyi TaxID=196109 RepID=A0A136IU88_9PEZI|nr:family 18 glycosyl hydrolase [Microdochium bolleyi]